MLKNINLRSDITLVYFLIVIISTLAISISNCNSQGLHKLKWHKEPKLAPETAFTDMDGVSVTISDFVGKVLIINLWATWCAPCIEEMPTLNNLQRDFIDSEIYIIALSQDRQGAKVAEPFVLKNGWTEINLYISDGVTFAREAGVRGLPTTLLIGKNGYELARLEGTIDWDTEEVKSLLMDLAAR